FHSQCPPFRSQCSQCPPFRSQCSQSVSPQAFWTRFFPAFQRLRALVAEGALGTPLLFRGSLGFNLVRVERLREPALGGGALLDLGCYGVQMALALMGGSPKALWAHGVLHPTGVDESVTVTMDFGGQRLATITCSMAAELPGGAALGGTKGWAQFPEHMNCPTELIWGGNKEVFPLPPPSQPLNFSNGTGLRFEAQHVRECLLQGLTESPVMPLAESELIARLLEQARDQVGAAGPGGGAQRESPPLRDSPEPPQSPPGVTP
ncbi:trans-1,2-dihydrobenzene-1,2-diol dehydrogenase, partial [Corapipo altera]|uniref:trans-1,2-dihydrobenzene-1,2-diol dehydrogenase n=1 Tax=Corapipo altera TaxID=415028 RepID=UPI000FD68AF2